MTADTGAREAVERVRAFLTACRDTPGVDGMGIAGAKGADGTMHHLTEDDLSAVLDEDEQLAARATTLDAYRKRTAELLDEKRKANLERKALEARVAELEAERQADVRAVEALIDAAVTHNIGAQLQLALGDLDDRFADRIDALGTDDAADRSNTTAECGDNYGRPDDDPLVCTLDQGHVGTHCGQGAEWPVGHDHGPRTELAAVDGQNDAADGSAR